MSLKGWRQRRRFDRYTGDLHGNAPVEPAPVTPVSRAEEVPPQAMPKYRICERCVHSYVYDDPDGVDRLKCRFMNRPIVEVLEAGVHTCGMFEEHLGCMHCEHRVSEPVTLLNGDMIVKCERMRATFPDGAKVTIGWDRMNTGKKCTSYCKKEDE